ncbi:cation:proton antiporter [Rubrobacter indicoceani]|uniref:cation:proton antiporter n=1 Tax=Rubrobacter indicoceani TaxID=2051957 RepID=UPI000E5B1D23|nr:cation:proton antiporter [Rubrobacter indicoceani]
MDHLVFEVGAALVLAAVATLLANRFKFSNVPFLIIIGMVVGPHIPAIGPLDLGFEESYDLLQFLGRVGVLFLLFYLGLEFSIGRLINSGRSIAVGGSVYIGINFTLGLLFGWLAGFQLAEILIVAGIITISSSAIVAKMLVDLRRTANPETEMILGIIMFEDIFLAVYLSILSGLVLSEGGSVGGTIITMLIVLGYILLFFVLARKASPFLNRVLDIRSSETFILVVFAALFFVAGFSETLHVAEAIGALLLGLVLSETEHRQRIERLVIPFRDFFGAIFFFSFGLSIDPLTLLDAALLSVLAVVLTIAGNFVAGMIAGRNAGLSSRASANVGLTIVSRGEFSIIVASLAIGGGLSGLIQPFAALYVLILSLLGPLLTKESGRIFGLVSKAFSREKAADDASG